MRLKNTQTEKWTHIIDADYNEADTDQTCVEDAVKSAANRIIEREYGTDHFCSHINNRADTYRMEIKRAVGGMQENVANVDFELQHF